MWDIRLWLFPGTGDLITERHNLYICFTWRTGSADPARRAADRTGFGRDGDAGILAGRDCRKFYIELAGLRPREGLPAHPSTS